uniref:Uncharacterized protein n=1 Tax=Solanum tuberosum TaxID=4113 RepID=M1DF58_SOLTU
MRIPFSATFMCILSYWNLERARSLVNGSGVCVDLSDIIEKNDNKKYEDKIFTFRKLSNDDYYLSIVKLIKNRGLSVGDEIGNIGILIYQSQFSNYFLRVCFVVWDVTEENVPKKYQGGSVLLRKLNNDEFSLWCIELFKDRGLSDGDEIKDPIWRTNSMVEDYRLNI